MPHCELKWEMSVHSGSSGLRCQMSRHRDTRFYGKYIWAGGDIHGFHLARFRPIVLGPHLDYVIKYSLES